MEKSSTKKLSDLISYGTILWRSTDLKKERDLSILATPFLSKEKNWFNIRVTAFRKKARIYDYRIIKIEYLNGFFSREIPLPKPDNRLLMTISPTAIPTQASINDATYKYL